MRWISNKIKRINLKKIISILLAVCLSTQLTGCLFSNGDYNLKTSKAYVEGEEEGNDIVKRLDSAWDRMDDNVREHDMERFRYLEGTNAFYILPGLENDPLDMVDFKLLDYTDEGEFIYYYITPCWVKSSEILKYTNDKKYSSGKAETTGFYEPKRSKKYSPIDAEVLMAYNPETGNYRVMFLDLHENSIDGKSGVRPLFIRMDVNKIKMTEFGIMTLGIKQWGYASKVPGQNEYFIFRYNGTGVVYNAKGEIVNSMDYSADLLRTLTSMWRDFYTNKTQNYMDIIPSLNQNVIITDVVANSSYQLYTSVEYTGRSLSETYTINRTVILYFSYLGTSPVGKAPDLVFTAYNINADKQNERWLSLNNRYFDSKFEMENNAAYNMNNIRSSEDIPDILSPFTCVKEISGNEIDYSDEGETYTETYYLAGNRYSNEFSDNLYRLGSNEYKDDELGFSKLKLDRKNPFGYLKYGMGIYEIQACHNDAAIFFDNIIKKMQAKNSNFSNVLNVLSNYGLLPDSISDQNPRIKTIGGYVLPKDISAKMAKRLTNTQYIPGYMVLKTTQGGGENAGHKYEPEVYTIHYYNSVIDKQNDLSNIRYQLAVSECCNIGAVINSYRKSLSRTVWYKDKEAAEMRLYYYKQEHPETADVVDAMSKCFTINEYGQVGVASTVATYEELKDSDEKLKNDIETFIASALIGAKIEESTKKALSARLQSLSAQLPEEDRNKVLSYCVGYTSVDETIPEGTIPYSYRLDFPAEVGIVQSDMPQLSHTSGYLYSSTTGTFMLFDLPDDYNGEDIDTSLDIEDSNQNKKTTDLAKPRKTPIMTVTDIYNLKKQLAFRDITMGGPIDMTESVWNSTNDSDKRLVFTILTDEGVRFYKKVGKRLEPVEFSSISQRLVKEKYKYTYRKYPYHANWTQTVDYTPTKEDIKGFIPLRYLMTSTGYTEDSEDKMGINKKSEVDMDVNYKRLSGTIPSSDAFTFIDKNLLYICSMGEGIRILDMNSGEIMREETLGSFYKLVRKGMSDDYLLIGFETPKNSDVNYQAMDYPMAKLYKVSFSKNHIEKINIEALKTYLLRLAKDYLYRPYRTEWRSDGKLYNIEPDDYEKYENSLFQTLFASDSTAAENNKSIWTLTDEGEALLKEMEEERGITSDPKEVRDYLEYLKKQAAAQTQAIVNAFLYSGSSNIITNTELMNEPYWRNLKGRLSNAETLSNLEELLVEIRTSEPVRSQYPEKAKEYEEFRKILEFDTRQKPNTSEVVENVINSQNTNNAGQNAETTNIILETTDNNTGVSGPTTGATTGPTTGDTSDLPTIKNPDAPEKKENTDSQKNETSDDAKPADKSASANSASANSVSDNDALEAQRIARQKAQCILSVVEDIKNEFMKNYPNKDYEKTMNEMLNNLNPENMVMLKEQEADEFCDILNHGPYVIKDQPFEDFKTGIKKGLPEIDCTWKLEKLIISEKIKLPGYQKHKDAYELYEKTMSGKTFEEQAVSLRQSDFYKEIINDIKNDEVVKEFLKDSRTTWDNYLKEIIRHLGKGYVVNDKGEIEQSLYNKELNELKDEKLYVSENEAAMDSNLKVQTTIDKSDQGKDDGSDKATKQGSDQESDKGSDDKKDSN
ncbi:MAG: hypothetical protein K6F99_06080 [Lachnospiraceae bacterium]|nr:hypothetical protein [Lachnospiraceae bacterium]